MTGLWRRMVIILMITAALGSFPISSTIHAAETLKLRVDLLAPVQVKDFPGIEQKVKAKVTNETDRPVSDVMAYITMANLNNHMTVNLEDYSADKPVVVGTMQPRESKEIELPIRFVYTGSFMLYVTAVSSPFNTVQSSTAIPIEIISNSSMDPASVLIVTFGMPALMFGIMLVIGIIRIKNRRKAVLDNT